MNFLYYYVWNKSFPHAFMNCCVRPLPHQSNFKHTLEARVREISCGHQFIPSDGYSEVAEPQ